MPFKHDPAECFEDILDNIVAIERYLSGHTRETFEADSRTRDAAERCLVRICEAVRRLKACMTGAMPGALYGVIRDLGDRLHHAYDGIDARLIWDTIQNDLPSLKADTERALAELHSKQP
jgi:uncharacterized protein with HEPN domain